MPSGAWSDTELRVAAWSAEAWVSCRAVWTMCLHALRHGRWRPVGLGLGLIRARPGSGPVDLDVRAPYHIRIPILKSSTNRRIAIARGRAAADWIVDGTLLSRVWTQTQTTATWAAPPNERTKAKSQKLNGRARPRS